MSPLPRPEQLGRSAQADAEVLAQGGGNSARLQPWALAAVAAALALVLVLTYVPALRGPLSPSDRDSALRIPLVSSYRNIPFFFTRDFLMFSDGQFRPLSYAVLAAMRTVVPADRPLFWHLWLLGFHWLAAVLMFVVARRLLGRWLPAALGAGVYALHPLGSVVVTDVNQFHLLLGLVFYLGALACYLRPVGEEGPDRKARLATFVLFLAGIFTSKVVFTLPVLLLCYELLYRRSGLRRSIWRLLPYAAVVAVVWPLWWAWRAHPLHYRYHPYPEGSGWTSIVHTLSGLASYGRGLLGTGIPAVLTELVGEPSGWSDPPVLLGAAVLVLVVAGGLWALGRRSLLGLGLLLLVLGLVPFASVAWHQVAYPLTWSNLYVSVAGLGLVVAGALGSRARPTAGRGRRLAVTGLVGLAVVGFAVKTMVLARDWADPARYWARALRLNPDSARASVALGKVYLERGDVEQALSHLFCAPVIDLSESASAMALYYARHEEPLAALIQLEAVSSKVSGIVYGRTAVDAQVMELLGAPDYAEASWGRLLVGNPFNTEGMKQVARILNLKGFPRAARRLLRHALAIDPKDADAHALLERVKERERSLTPPTFPEPPPPDWLMFSLSGEASVPLRKQMVRLSQRLHNDPLVQGQAGTILLHEGHPQAALVAMDRALERLPRMGTFWALKALALDLTGDYRGAALAVNEAIELAPLTTDLPTLYNLLGVVLLSRANNPALNDPTALDQAIELFGAALKAGRELSLAHANLGVALAQKGRTEEALRHLHRAIVVAPTDTQSLVMLASVLAHTGDVDGARDMYNRALAIDPTSVRAHLSLGDLLAQTGDPEGAARHYLQMLRLRPGNPEALNRLGLLRARQGLLQEAIDYFRQALQQAPLSNEVRFNLVQALQQQGRYAEAVGELRDYLARTGNPSAQTALVWLLATCPEGSVRRGQEAVTLGEDLCQRTRYQAPVALQVLAAAYAEVGRFDEATRLVGQALALARADGQEQLATSLAKQLEHHQAERPFRSSGPPGAGPPPARRLLPPG